MRAVLVAALALVSCSLARRTPEIRYYTLMVPGVPPPSSVTLVVGRLTADEPYATPRLAYRTSPYRIDYYVFHRWAGDPRWIVASAARDYLDRAAAPAPGRASYELTGNVRRLEEVDDAAGCQAALALDLRIERDGRVVLARSYAETEPAEARRPEMVVAALSRALGRILDRALADLRSVARAGEDPSAHRGGLQLHRRTRGRPNLCIAERTWRRTRFCANSTSSAAS